MMLNLAPNCQFTLASAATAAPLGPENSAIGVMSSSQLPKASNAPVSAAGAPVNDENHMCDIQRVAMPVYCGFEEEELLSEQYRK